MHPVSVLTCGIFLAGYITARWDLVTRLYELAIFAWDHGVITRAAKGFGFLSVFFLLFLIPIGRIAVREAELVSPNSISVCARVQKLIIFSIPEHWTAASVHESSCVGEAHSSSLRDGIMTTKKHRLMRIFWPSDAPRDDIPAVLVGWRNSELDVLVVGVLQGVDVKNVEHALRVHSLFRGSPHPIEQILERCGKLPLQVLGTLNAPSTVLGFNPKLVSVRYGRRDTAPRIDCPVDAGVTIQVMMFDRPDPNRMQYLSITPISLALGDKHGAYGSLPPFDQIDKEEEAAKRRKLKLINCSAEIDNLMQRNISLVGVRMKRTLSVSERMVESATNAWDTVLLSIKQALIQNVWPVASQIFILLLMAQRIMAEGILFLLDWRPLPNSPAALKDVSATAQQLDIRLQQFCYWPVQYSTLQQRRNNWESITKSHPEYIRFYNSLWLVANDVIIGIAIGSYILENADTVAALVDDTVDRYSIAGLQRMITWLMDWPAGLKLNNELAKFLGDLFLWVIDYWDGSMIQLRPLLPHIVRLIGVSSFAGASMPISLFSDLVSLLTIHIYSFYIASARIYNWQLTIIHSLFHLFRGKKRNILRNRIDSCDYDLDQLLLGTILFTVLFFLLPTVAVFYATFAGARMAIIALKAALDTWLACLNHFPLFAIMLRLKDSRRIPGGIRFELQDTPSASLIMARPSAPPKPSASHAWACTPTSYIKLKSVPLPLSQTFSQYAQLGHRLRKHYLSPRVFWCLITGQFVPPIHRKNLYSLQYSMLPAQRVTITELWNLLHRKEAGAPHANGHAVLPALNKGAGKKTKGYWWSR